LSQSTSASGQHLRAQRLHPLNKEGTSIMTLVIIGGTGLIGTKLVARLREHGHEAIAASPDTGVNTLTGQGLAEALRGAGGAPG
jgi:hypothetical protein